MPTPSLRKDLYRANLRPGISSEFRFLDCADFAAVMKFAKIAEASALRAPPVPTPPPAMPAMAAVHSTSRRPRGDRDRPRTRPAPSSCTWCGIPGHSEHECRGKKSGRPRRAPAHSVLDAPPEAFFAFAVTARPPKPSPPTFHSRIPLVDIFVSSLAGSAALDSACATSLISASFATRAQLKVSSSSKALVAANSSPVAVLGATSATIRLSDRFFDVEFLVVEDLALDALLGWDFFKAHRAILDPMASTVVVDGTSIPLTALAAPFPALAVKAADPKLHLSAIEFGTSAPADQICQVRALVSEFSDIFARDADQFGSANVPPVVLNVSPGPPIRMRPIPLSRPDAEEMNGILNLWLRQGRISPSDSPFAARTFLVPKDSSGKRAVTDFSALNSRIERDNQPPPDARAIFDSFSGCLFFSKLDFQQSYLQIPVAPESRKYLSFVCAGGQYEFNYLPFGLNVSGDKLQRILSSLLRHVPGTLGYVDDYPLAHRTFPEHLSALRLAFEAIRDSGFLLKPSKCSFMLPEIPFLGRLVSASGNRPDPVDVQAIIDFPRPSSLKELQRFLGSAQWLSPFVTNFQSVLAPLRPLLSKSARWNWSPDCEAAFRAVKALMASPDMLAFPDFSRTFTLETDASELGFGAVLLQDGRPVAYASRATKPAEQGGLHSTLLELACVVWAVEKFHVYLHGSLFELVTDHQALTFLRARAHPHGKLARWAATLAGYDFTVTHRPGRLHTRADALSCAFPASPAASPVFATPPLPSPDSASPPSVAEFLAAQSADVLIVHIARSPSSEVVTSPDGVVCNLSHRYGMPVFKPLVPLTLRSRVISACHLASAHMGVSETARRVRASYSWPGILADVRAFVSSCAPCLARKPPARRRTLPVGTLAAERPCELVACDVLTVQPSSDGFNYLLVVVDHFSRYAALAPLRTKSSAEIAQAFDDVWLRPFGPPERLLSDQGPEFSGFPFSALATRYGFSRSWTTPYHPQGDSVAERLNSTVLSLLSTSVGPQKHLWPSVVTRASIAYNTATHSSTGFTPFLLFFGRPHHSVSVVSSPSSPLSHALEASDARRTVSALSKSLKAYRASQNSRSSVVRFQVNQLVFVRDPASGHRPHSKLADPWAGPFRVLKVSTPSTYVVQQLPSGRSGSVHVQNMKPYAGPPPSSHAVANNPAVSPAPATPPSPAVDLLDLRAITGPALLPPALPAPAVPLPPTTLAAPAPAAPTVPTGVTIPSSAASHATASLRPRATLKPPQRLGESGQML